MVGMGAGGKEGGGRKDDGKITGLRLGVFN